MENGLVGSAGEVRVGQTERVTLIILKVHGDIYTRVHAAC